jgi:nitrogen-specific signal transduction histidine kinase
MEKQIEMSGMLEMVPQPAFLVDQNTIVLVNQAARQLTLEVGTPVASMLFEDAQEYSAFDGGCLCLTLSVAGCPMSAAVTRMNTLDLFVIDPIPEPAELKAMALTAIEFREPLSDIMTIKEHIIDAVAPDRKDATDPWVAQMNRRINQMHRALCNMADAAQYAAEARPKMAFQNVCAVLDEVFERSCTLVEKAGYHLNYSGLSQNITCLIAADRLERCIYNILSNAMKNSPVGSTIDATLTRRGKKLYLSIQDYGNGVPPHLLSSLYSRYRRRPGLEDPDTGLGLGMVLVRNTATIHGGTVLIDQPQGRGTRITISLSIRTSGGETVRTGILPVDYAGEYDHALLELSDVLPPEFYL